MAGDHLSNDEFLTRLTTLFEANRKAAHGSVILSQKRLTPQQPPKPKSPSSSSPTLPRSSTAPFEDLHTPDPLPILIRATDGNDKKDKRVKLSTVVQPADLEGFFARYAEGWKAGMSGLKKRDRSGRKAKAKGKKKKGKEGEEGKVG